MAKQSSGVTSPLTASPDPTKRVNYVTGMVLGVDDFTQQFSYHEGRTRWQARDLSGYGTVAGLAVGQAGTAGSPEIQVGPGTAVVPSGRRVVVPATQCAQLNAWLKRESAEIQRLRQNNATSMTISVSVVLGHHDCPTDTVPLPGEPCRTEEEALAPSRIKDDFRLTLRLDSPDQQEEEALRVFVDWVATIPVSDTTSSSNEEELVTALRKAAEKWLTTKSPPFTLGTAPPNLSMSTANAPQMLRSLFRIWTVELRPQCRPADFEAWCGCGEVSQAAVSSGQDEVLLAELNLDLTVVDSPFSISCNKVTIDESRRPFLLHTRFLQEWLLARSRVAQTAAGSVSLQGDVTGVSSATTVKRLQGTPVLPNSPKDSQVLTFESGNWSPQDLPNANGEVTGPLTNLKVSQLAGFAVADSSTAATGHVLTLVQDTNTNTNHWVPQPPNEPPKPTTQNLSGDVTGPPQANSVAMLQGVGVAPQSNSVGLEGEVLAINNSGQWTRAPLPTAKGDVVGPWNDLSVEKLRGVPLPASWTLPNPSDSRFLRLTQDISGNKAWQLATIDLKGDVNGASQETVVSRIQGFPITKPIANTPGNLAFDGTEFVVDTKSPPTDIVRAPKAKVYEIVAAGTLNLKDGTPWSGISFGGLRMQPSKPPFSPGGSPWLYRLEFDNPPRARLNQYVIKATPCLFLTPNGSQELPALLVNVLIRVPQNEILIVVHRVPGLPEMTLDGGLSVEVSRFEV